MGQVAQVGPLPAPAKAGCSQAPAQPRPRCRHSHPRVLLVLQPGGIQGARGGMSSLAASGRGDGLLQLPASPGSGVWGHAGVWGELCGVWTHWVLWDGDAAAVGRGWFPWRCSGMQELPRPGQPPARGCLGHCAVPVPWAGVAGAELTGDGPSAVLRPPALPSFPPSLSLDLWKPCPVVGLTSPRLCEGPTHPGDPPGTELVLPALHCPGGTEQGPAWGSAPATLGAPSFHTWLPHSGGHWGPCPGPAVPCGWTPRFGTIRVARGGLCPTAQGRARLLPWAGSRAEGWPGTGQGGSE